MCIRDRNYGVGATSADGSNWSVNYITGTNINGVAFGNNTFVAAVGDEYGSYGTIFSSADGVTWTKQDSAATEYSLSGITYANSTFVAVGGNGTIITSSSEVSSYYKSTQLALYNLDNDLPTDVTVAVSSSNTEEATVDHYTRTLTFTPDNWMNPQTVQVHGVDDDAIDGHRDYQVGLSSEILEVISAGTSWSTQDAGYQSGIKGVAHGNDTFVAVGEYGGILTSSDGSTWTQHYSSTQSILHAIAFGNNTFVAVGDNGIMVTSPDGICLLYTSPSPRDRG